MSFQFSTHERIAIRLVAAFLIGIATTYTLWQVNVGLEGDLLAIFRAFTIPRYPWEIDVTSIVVINIGLIVYAVIHMLMSEKKEQYGNAEWGSKRHLAAMGLNYNQGFVLGKLDGKYICMDDPYCALIIAPPGAWKSASNVIPTLLLLQNSVIVHDPKGELHRITGPARSKFSEVYAFDTVSEFTATFNPFSKAMLPADWDDLKGYIKNIASVLIKDTERDTFFPGEARNGFVFFACWLIWKQGETSFAQIRVQILGPDTKSDTLSIVKAMLDEENLPSDIFQTGKALLSNAPSENQWTGVVVTMTRALEVFDDRRTIRATSGESHFNGYMLRKKCISLYLKIRDIDRDKLGPLISLIFEIVAKQLLSEDYKPNKHYKVSFIMDEFVRLGNMPVLKELPSLSRSYGVNVMFIAQDYGQIAELYQEAGVSIFETNGPYKVVFRQNNYLTAERISKVIGNKTDTRLSYSKDNRKLFAGTTSVSTAAEGLPLVSPQFVLNLPKGKCILLCPGHLNRPLLLEACAWFNDAKLSKLVPPSAYEEINS